jgi:amidohydrolase
MSDGLLERATAWRRHLHANPELSRHEAETARFVCAQLDALGLSYVANVGGHGVVATLRRGASNRSVGLRADMDALPIDEATNLPYASRRPGVMHACGHDGHTASLLAAAALLAADESWSGTVQLVFQPAEEGAGGARAMLADGLFTRFPMERIFGYHNWPGLAAGTVAVHAGPVMAAGSRLEIRLDGRAGHAAMPHRTRDPIVAAGHLLAALQSVVSREVDPLDAAVVSICTIEAGTATNQIPERATLRGTFRTYRADVHDAVAESIRRVAAGIGSAFGVGVAVDFSTHISATVNSGPEADLAADAAAVTGVPLRRDLPPSTASEDFGCYLEEKPGAFAWIGNGEAGEGQALHNPGYDYNDAILPIAARWLATVARRALQA